MNIEAIGTFSSRHILLSPLLMGLIGRAKTLNQVFMLMLFHDVVLLRLVSEQTWLQALGRCNVDVVLVIGLHVICHIMLLFSN